jgi:hypothetical protein
MVWGGGGGGLYGGFDGRLQSGLAEGRSRRHHHDNSKSGAKGGEGDGDAFAFALPIVRARTVRGDDGLHSRSDRQRSQPTTAHSERQG